MQQQHLLADAHGRVVVAFRADEEVADCEQLRILLRLFLLKIRNNTAIKYTFTKVCCFCFSYHGLLELLPLQCNSLCVFLS